MTEAEAAEMIERHVEFVVETKFDDAAGSSSSAVRAALREPR